MPTIEHPRTQAHFQEVRRVLAAYLALSAATVVAMALLRHDPGRVTSAVWTRGIVATISAAVLNHNHLRSVFADG